MRKLKIPTDPLQLGRMAEEALRLAVYKAIKDHERTRDPVVIWKNGKVVHIPAHKLKVRRPRLKYKPK